MQIEAVINYVTGILETKLPPDLYYHTVGHTIDVMNAASNYSRLEKINDYDSTILQIAALFHDVGYIIKYKNNEEDAIKITYKILPKFEFTEIDIVRINGCILATKIPQAPKNYLEEIICDSDLDYLGREDYFEISEKLRKEWQSIGIIDGNMKKWYEIQLKFMTGHTYFTSSAINLRNSKKLEHIYYVKQQLNQI